MYRWTAGLFQLRTAGQDRDRDRRRRRASGGRLPSAWRRPARMSCSRQAPSDGRHDQIEHVQAEIEALGRRALHRADGCRASGRCPTRWSIRR